MHNISIFQRGYRPSSLHFFCMMRQRACFGSSGSITSQSSISLYLICVSASLSLSPSLSISLPLFVSANTDPVTLLLHCCTHGSTIITTCCMCKSVQRALREHSKGKVACSLWESVVCAVLPTEQARWSDAVVIQLSPHAPTHTINTQAHTA